MESKTKSIVWATICTIILVVLIFSIVPILIIGNAIFVIFIILLGIGALVATIILWAKVAKEYNQGTKKEDSSVSIKMFSDGIFDAFGNGMFKNFDHKKPDVKIECPYCGGSFSEHLDKCPNCGASKHKQ